jgi:putative membrane protein
MNLAPLSVPYRAAERGISLVFTLAFLLFSTSSFLGPLGPLASVGLLGAAVLLVVGYEVAYYQRFEYELTPDTFDVRSGVVSRRNREIPLRRIQNVDISRNVVQRVLGLAAVTFETAGGGEAEGSLRFVTFEEAKRLQAEIARLKRGTDADGEPAPEPPTEELFSLSDRELALVGLLSFDLRVPGIAVFLLSGSVPFVSSLVPGNTTALVGVVGVGLLVVAVLLFSWFASAVVAVLNYYGFRLTRTDDELQYERGLLQRYDGSIPLDKIQTLTVTDNPLKRHFGYATLEIETAGFSGGGEGGARGSEAAVPLATRERVVALANEIDAIGEPEFERPPKRIRRRYAVRYLIVTAVLTGVAFGANLLAPQPVPWYLVAAVLPAIPVAAHLKWRHRGHWLGPDHVVTRNGVWNRETKVVPYYRVQTVLDTRTIFQRRWRVATVTVDTAGSLSILGRDAAAVDVARETADHLREELSERLRVAVASGRTRRRPRATFDAGEGAVVGDESVANGVAEDGPTTEGTTETGSSGATDDGRRPGDEPGDTGGFVFGDGVEGDGGDDAPSDGSAADADGADDTSNPESLTPDDGPLDDATSDDAVSTDEDRGGDGSSDDSEVDRS